MVMAKLHIICGNCGCNDEFEYKNYINYINYSDEGIVEDRTTITCKNCGTIHSLEDNAKHKKFDKAQVDSGRATIEDYPLSGLEKESSELKEKLIKLSAFIGSDAFGDLDAVSSGLLLDQSRYMEWHMNVLKRRLALSSRT